MLAQYLLKHTNHKSQWTVREALLRVVAWEFTDRGRFGSDHICLTVATHGRNLECASPTNENALTWKPAGTT